MDSKLVAATENRRPPNAGKGRPVGSVNKTTAAVKETLMAAFEEVGGLEITNVPPEERVARVAAIFDAARARRDRDAINTA